MTGSCSRSSSSPALGSGEPGADAHEPAPLRLSVTRGALGLELSAPVKVGLLEVSLLTLSLPGLSYPLDLSGGVARFRSRRGLLERLVLGFTIEDLASWLARAAAHELGELERAPMVTVDAERVRVGLCTGTQALAFDLWWAPDGSEPRFVVGAARGVGLKAPALGCALRILASGLSDIVVWNGRMFAFTAVPERVCLEVLPAQGVRVPAIEDFYFASRLEPTANGLRSVGERGAIPEALSKEALTQLERATLFRKADELLVAGEVEAARSAYLACLEEAPRHPEALALLGELDRATGVAVEVALSWYQDAARIPASPVEGWLLAALGEEAAAEDRYHAFADGETYGPLAALALLEAARLCSDPERRQRLLDVAVARCPSLLGPRWERFFFEVRGARVARARADAGHLEQQVGGARMRGEVCSKVAQAFLDGGFSDEAAHWFERVLRYLPEDQQATLGLARCFHALGKDERAMRLLMRAVELGERGGGSSEAELELALLLATVQKDLPHAIARVRRVEKDPQKVCHARYLEASWRAQLGDKVGAVVAYLRMREALEHSPEPPREAASWLQQAAEYLEREAADLAAAHRCLMLAAALAPADVQIREHLARVSQGLLARRLPGG